MSSYNEIAKVKYKQESTDVVTLSEYVVFGDERAQKKVVVFKFENNVNQQLLGMSFEVSQYDGDDALIEKSVVVYTKFLARANETFVPQAKLPVNYECAKISIKLLKAAFDRFVWDDGKYIDNSYKFSHYVHDEEIIEQREAVVAAAAAPAPRKAPRPKVFAFGSRNIMRKNIARFPTVFNWFICIIVIAFVAVSLYFYRTQSKRMTVNNFDLRILDENSNSVAVCGYFGEYGGQGSIFIVPAKVGGYEVVEIDKGAFNRSTMYGIEFQSPNLIISSEAFSNCKNLSNVRASENSRIIVKTKAFTDCTQLRTIDLPNSGIEENAFFGSFSIGEMNIGDVARKVTSYRQLVGASETTLLSRPRFSYTSLPTDESDFFDGID